MSKYAYLKPIVANPRQCQIDLNFLLAKINLAHGIQPSKLAAIAERGWGTGMEKVTKTARRLDQLVREAGSLITMPETDPRRAAYAKHLAEAGFPTDPDGLARWFAAAETSRPNLHKEPVKRPSDYYDRPTITLFGMQWIELPPDCRTGSFSKPATKAHGSPSDVVEELKTRGMPQGDLCLKRIWDGRWQAFQRRQIVGRSCTPMGSYAKKAPLGSGRLFIQ